MARQEINLGTPPTGVGGDSPRSTGVKINAMTLELYASAGLANSSGWGGVNPPVMPEGSDANLLTGTKIVLFNNGVNLPDAQYWFVENVDNGGGYMTQRAMKYTSRGYAVRQKHPTTGWTPWETMITDAVWVPAKLLPNANANTLALDGEYSTLSEWVGSPAPGLSGINQGFLSHRTWTQAQQQYRSQTFRYLDGTITSVDGGNILERRYVAGQWQPWFRITNGYNLEGNVTTPLSGSAFQVGTAGSGAGQGWYQFDRGGRLICTIYLGDRAMAANEVYATGISLPAAFTLTKSVVVTGSIIPTQSHDNYGLVNGHISSSTNAVVAFRNGAVAQSFNNMAVCVTGWWK